MLSNKLLYNQTIFRNQESCPQVVIRKNGSLRHFDIVFPSTNLETTSIFYTHLKKHGLESCEKVKTHLLFPCTRCSQPTALD